MSIKVMSYVFEHSDAKLADRLVLLTLADYAHDDGRYAFPSVETIARKSRVGVSTARGCLRSLESAGEIRHVGETKHGTRMYTVLMPKLGTPESGPPSESGATPPGSGPNPLRTTTPFSSNNNGSEEEQFRLELQEGPVRENGDKPKLVDKKQVTKAERATAHQVLAVFNEAAGTRYRAIEFVEKIVRRIREHPAMTVEDHKEVIVRQFKAPWWRGRATPAVIYGNASVFETAIHSDPATMGRTKAERRQAMLKALDKISGGEDW